MTIQSELRAIAERVRAINTPPELTYKTLSVNQRLTDIRISQPHQDRARLLELVLEWLEAEAKNLVRRAMDRHTRSDAAESILAQSGECSRLAREWREMVGGK